jgi:predicted transcriptional regulator
MLTLMKNINEKIRDLLASGFTQKKLGETIGVSQAVISDLFTGKQKDMGIERGGRMVDALHVTHCSNQAN